MKICDLIELYITQSKICSEINFEDKKSVKANNNAIDKMYKIIEDLKNNFSNVEFEEFYLILDIKDFGVNLWGAIHLLEKISLPNIIKNKALKIITNEIKNNESNSYGLQIWLDNWTKNNSK
jgi:hypothetical protein